MAEIQLSKRLEELHYQLRDAGQSEPALEFHDLAERARELEESAEAVDPEEHAGFEAEHNAVENLDTLLDNIMCGTEERSTLASTLDASDGDGPKMVEHIPSDLLTNIKNLLKTAATLDLVVELLTGELVVEDASRQDEWAELNEATQRALTEREELVDKANAGEQGTDEKSALVSKVEEALGACGKVEELLGNIKGAMLPTVEDTE